MLILTSTLYCLICFTTAMLSGHQEKHLRIIKGYYVREDQFQSVVVLLENGEPICVGTIIDPSWILLAAHCFETNGHRYQIGFGSTSIENSVKYNIHEIHIHEAYYSRHATTVHDIALIKLKLPLKDDAEIMATLETQDTVGGDCVALGWGKTENSESSDRLLYYNTTSISNDQCRAYWSSSVFDIHICTKPVQHKDTCAADSGGPLICDGKVVGVLGFGSTPCAIGVPSVYTRVSRYIDWIKFTVEKHSQV